MPQTPQGVRLYGLDPSGNAIVLQCDADGNLIVVPATGAGTEINIAAGGVVAGALVDGADLTQGLKADAAWAAGAGSVIALLKAIATAAVQMVFGANGALIVANGKLFTTNITAAAVVKNAATRAVKVIIIDPGTTGGAFTLNNCATVGAAAAANVVWTQAYNAAAAVKGQVVDLNVPCDTGLVVSAVPTGGTPIIAVVYN